MGGGWGQRRTGPRVGGYPVGSSGPAPWTPPPPPKFPGASEAGAGWGTQGALCRGGGGRGCASLGAGPAGGMGAADSQRRLVRGRPPSASGRRRLGSLRASLRPRLGLRADPAPCPLVGAHWAPSAAAYSCVARLEAASSPSDPVSRTLPTSVGGPPRPRLSTGCLSTWAPGRRYVVPLLPSLGT